MDACSISTTKLIYQTELYGAEHIGEKELKELTNAALDSKYLRKNIDLQYKVISLINNSIRGVDTIFIDWLSYKSGLLKDGEIITKDTAYKILKYDGKRTNLNTFKKWIDNFVEYIDNGVGTRAKQRAMDIDTMGFRSKQAFDDALDFTARTLTNIYFREYRNNKNIKEQDLQNITWLKTKYELIHKFLTIYNYYLTGGVIKASNDISEKLNNLDTTLEAIKSSYINEVKNAREQIAKNKELILKKKKEIDAFDEDSEDYNRIKKEIDDLRNENKELTNSILTSESRKYQEYFSTFAPLVHSAFNSLEYDSRFYRLKNFGAISYNLITDSTAWREKVLGIPIMLNLKRDFENINEFDKIYIQDSGDSNDESNDIDREGGIDESTKSWTNKVADYKSLFGGKMYAYFASFPKLDSPQKIGRNGRSETYDFSSDTEIGAPSYYSPIEIINAISAFCSTISVEKFKESVKKLASHPAYYGLIKLVDDMENDAVFANTMASTFAVNVVHKITTTIDNDGSTKVRPTNISAFHKNDVYLRLFNSAKEVYAVALKKEDEAEINKYNELLKGVNKKYIDSFSKNYAKDILKMNSFIRKYLHKYFPDMNVDAIEKLILNSSDKYTLLKNIFSTFDEFNKASMQIVINRDKADEKFKKDRDNAYEYSFDPMYGTQEKVLKPGKDIPKYDYDSLNFDLLRKPILKIADLFFDAIDVQIRLNSRTPKNTMSSDMIKNSYLTNFFKMLHYIEENEVDELVGDEYVTSKQITNEGAKILQEFFNKDNSINGFHINDMAFSTILWGVRDSKGQIVKKGIFTKNDDGSISINTDVVNTMNYALFNGIKNNIFNAGVEYDSMSSRDYWISTILSIMQPLDYNYDAAGEINNYGGFMLRIPSDAGNNYCVQMPKYKTSNRFVFNNHDISTIFNVYSPIIGNLNFLKDKGYLDAVTKFYDKFAKEVANPIEYIKYNRIEDVTELLTILETQGNLNLKNNPSSNKLVDIRRFTKFDVTAQASKNGITSSENGKIYLIPRIYLDKYNNSIILWQLIDGKENGAGEVKATLGSTALYYDTNNENGPYASGKVSFHKIIESNLIEIANHLNDGNHNVTINRIYDKDSAIVRGFRQQLLYSFSNMADALKAILKYDEETNTFIINDSTDDLFENYHYKGSSPLEKTKPNANGKRFNTGRLTGNVFNVSKLFEIDGYNPLEELKRIFLFYGEEGNDNSIFQIKGKNVIINPNRNNAESSPFIVKVDNTPTNSNGITVTLNEDLLDKYIDEIVIKWLDTYENYILKENAKYKDTFAQAGYPMNDNITSAILNYTIINMEFDDLFEGNGAFYKDAQTFLKRAKEVQANGSAYMGAIDFSSSYDAKYTVMHEDIALIGEQYNDNGELIDESGNVIKDKDDNPIKHSPISIGNSFRGVTIKNTYTRYDDAAQLHDTLLNYLKSQNIAGAEQMAADIASAFGWNNGAKTCANDAQSYITLDEFIRRRWADGTIGEYGDILYKLKYFPNEQLTPEELATIGKKIQAQKNVYYDRQFDPKTNIHYSRFIKNAEFVLIPQFLAPNSGLRVLYDLMIENNIQQVNTAETSKASNKNVLTFWSKDNKTFDDGTVRYFKDEFSDALKDDSNVEIYYYRSLYKQQDVVDHIDNTENKAGIQVVKKILDNESTYSDVVKEAVKTIQDNFSANIKEDFDALMLECGWEVLSDGRIVNAGSKSNEGLNFDVFYDRAKEEAQRLGLDSNFLSFLEVDEHNQPILPTWMNSASSKLESIAQSIFNKNITRQTLPGFHAVQVANVGYSKRLHYYIDNEGNRIIECALPMWDENIKKLYNKYKKAPNWKKLVLRDLEKAGLDKFFGYRIPTEGKQSMGIFKVVDILDSRQGSTIIVPSEWVTKTGSDFDIDTIYAIIYETIYKNKTKTIAKITDDNLTDEELYANYFKKAIRRVRRSNNKDYEEILNEYNSLNENSDLSVKELSEYALRLKEIGLNVNTFDEFVKLPKSAKLSKEQRNNKILEAFITIMSDISTLEEEAFRSNFDDITKTKKAKEALLFGDAENTRSVYNPHDQVKYMQNAIDGRKLKAFSVNRDTFNSVNNILRTELGKDDVIKVKYDLNKYNIDIIKSAYDEVEVNEEEGYAIVTHNKIGNSINNRNVVGKLITQYSSETTAHILDAIKEGALYNETDLTFKVFKTLVDCGLDYDTAISFLMQPAITRINDNYERTNSIFTHNYNSPVDNIIKELLNELGVLNEAEAINQYTNNTLLPSLCEKNNELTTLFREVWGVDLLYRNKTKLEFNTANFVIDEKSLDSRLVSERNLNDKKYNETEEDRKKRLIYDLGIALLYKKYNKTSQNIEDIANCAKPDAFGAKQTIHSTKAILDNIETFSDPDDPHASTLVVTVDGEKVPMLQALYPNFGRNEFGNYILDADKSKYKYLAYFLKYSTIPSVTANSQLFETEGADFTRYTNMIEARLGRKFTDEEYQEFKKYTISQVYYRTYSLIMPMTINDAGMIVEDSNSIVDEKGVALTDDQRIKREIARIFGYSKLGSDSFTFKDINHPTEEELKEYAKLSPLQKVNLIKLQCPLNSGIFGDINTVKEYLGELASSGHSYNRLTINTLKQDMFNFYSKFIKAFSEDNPVFKLAAVDLVKYAFLVEGGRYRNTTISKIIPTEVLKATTNEYGMNLVNDFKVNYDNLIKDFVKMSSIEEINSSVDNFVRSHSYLLKNTTIPRPKQNPDSKNTLGDIFNSCELLFSVKRGNDKITQKSGLIRIPNTGDYQELLDVLLSHTDNDISYIKLKHYTTSSSKPIYTLYKVVPYGSNGNIIIGEKSNKIDSYFLVPLPMLEQNEVYDYSYNTEYNDGYYDKSLYNWLIKQHYNLDIDFDVKTKITTTESTSLQGHNKNKLLNAEVNDAAGKTKMKQLAINFLSESAKWNYVNEALGYVYLPYCKEIDIATLLNGTYSFAPNVQTIKGFNGQLIDAMIGMVVSDKEFRAYELSHNLPSNSIKRGELYTLRIASNKSYDTGATSKVNTGDDTHTTSTGGNETSRFGGIYRDVSSVVSESREYDTTVTLAKEISNFIIRESENPNNRLSIDAKKQMSINNISTKTMEDIAAHRKDIYHIAADLLEAKADIIQNGAWETVIAKESALVKNYANNNPTAVVKYIKYKTIENGVEVIKFAHVKATEEQSFLTRNNATKLSERIFVNYEYFGQKGIYEFVKGTVKKFESNGISSFEVDGLIYSIDDMNMYEALHNSAIGSQHAQELYTLLIKSKSFGSSINDIQNIYIIDGENDDITNSIKRIQNAISSVHKNQRVNFAIKQVFNNYIAREYATNPLIKLKVVDLLDAFGDIDWFDNNFADVLNVNNNLIQVIVNLANTELSRAKLDAGTKVQQFKSFIKEIKQELGVESLDETFAKLIDENGRYIREYTDKWLEDKENLSIAVETAKADYGIYSKEYYRALINKDKWYAENVEQPGVAEYYKLKAQYEEEVFNNAPDAFIRYKELLDKIINSNDNLSELTDAQIAEKEAWNHELNNIKANNPAINKYIESIDDLNIKYLDQKGNRLWINRMNTMLDIVDKYHTKYPNKSNDELVNEYQDYKDAYNWLRLNTSYTYNKSILNQINKNLAILYGDKEESEEDTSVSAYRTILNSIKNNYADKLDLSGVLDGRLVSEDEVDKLRSAALERYSQLEGADPIDFNIIKNAYPAVVYSKELNDLFNNHFKKGVPDSKYYRELEEDAKAVVTEINKYLKQALTKKVINVRNRVTNEIEKEIIDVIDPVLLGNLFSIDELKHLNDLLNTFHTIKKSFYDDDEQTIEGVRYISETELFQIHYEDIIDNFSSSNKKDILLKIICRNEDNGSASYNNNGEAQARSELYSHVVIDKKYLSRYIDFNKTNAKRWLKNNTEYRTTSYYELAKNAALAKGDDYYKEWYAKNHIYNPYTHKMEPLAIWTERAIRADAVDIKDATKDYQPMWFNSDREFKKEYKNKSLNYSEGGINYRSTSTYDNDDYKRLNDTEIKLLDRLKYYSDYYAHNYRQRKFVKEGYAPRQYSPKIDAKWYVEQIANVAGIGGRNYSDRAWIDRLEYSKEPLMPFDMYELLKVKGFKKHEFLPNKFDYPNEDDYNARLKEVTELNKQIDKDNLELEKAYINRDWEQVFSTLILQGEEYNAKYNMKDLLYLTLEQLRSQEIFKTDTRTGFDSNVLKNRILSTIDNEVFKKTNSSRTADIFENWMRRYLYGQFHKNTKLRRYADSIQAYTTAKYMMLNLRGGIANVNTGLVNILGDQLAGIHFTTKEFVSAVAEYGKSVVGLIGDFIYEDGKASNEISAICRMFDIVDVDQMIGAPSSENKVTPTTFVNKTNTLLYSFMGTGEHFMQNSALIAMLNSHRVYFDNDTGKYVIGTFNNYIQGVEIQALKNIISNPNSEWNYLNEEFNNYIKNIKRDKNLAKKYSEFRRDIVLDFIKSDYVNPENGNRRKLAKEYIETRKKLIADAKIEFEGFETVRQQLVFDKEEGIEKIKEGSKITTYQLAKLRDNALEVNKQIHGVYDKMGAAKIESLWWGSLVMQYHKHIYPGYMKRWRRKGYWNETTNSAIKGSRTSLYDLIIKSFVTNQSFDTNYNNLDGIKSIKAISMKLLDIFTDFTLNYQTLSVWEQANIKRNLGDICGILSGILFTMLIYALWDDDDIKDNKLINTLLYLADRLYTESRMYNIMGAYAEFTTQWSQPIAALSMFKDAFKALNLLSQMMFNGEDFNPIYTNTQYKGQNKFGVLIKRNIPIVRVIQRYENVARNNKYYRINDNNGIQSSAKNIGSLVHDIFVPFNSRAYGANKRGGRGAIGEEVFY